MTVRVVRLVTGVVRREYGAEPGLHTPMSPRPSPSQSPLTGRSVVAPKRTVRTTGVAPDFAERRVKVVVAGSNVPRSVILSPFQSPVTGIDPVDPRRTAFITPGATSIRKEATLGRKMPTSVSPSPSQSPVTGTSLTRPIRTELVEPLSLRSRNSCLLYTSDAADDLLCVDLGG